MKVSWRWSRRRFLRSGWGMAVAGLVGLPGANPARSRSGDLESTPPARSRVVLIRRPEVLRDSRHAKPQILHEMLNEGVRALMREPSASAAWRRLFRADDVVGIKSNVWSQLPTPVALEQAIRRELLALGISAGDVAIDDRGVLGNPIFRRATALINVRPMRTHHWSGLGTCLKNMIMFVPRPADYHGDTCASLGAIWQLPELSGKVNLNILVMLTPQFHGVGPHSFSQRFTWPYYGLLLGTDPVAVDAVGARIIEAKRTAYFGEPRPISPPPHHIELASSRYGLGNSAMNRIDLVRLGWREESLI